MHSRVTPRDDTWAQAPAPEDTAARAAELCEQAAAARGSQSPETLLWLAEQLADTCRLLARLSAAGSIAADAYERGRLDERALHAAAGHLLPAM
jgi:hypothetical protein